MRGDALAPPPSLAAPAVPGYNMSMREVISRNKLVTALLVWSVLGAGFLFSSYSVARDHFEQYMQYTSFAPEWKPRFVEIGQHGLFWTMWVPKFPANGKVEYGEETFFVPPSEQARMLEICHKWQIPVHGSPTPNLPYADAAIVFTPALLALWLLSRRRGPSVTVLGCRQAHRAPAAAATTEEQHQPLAIEATANAQQVSTAKIKAMQNVHVFSMDCRRREFIKRL